MPGAPARFPSGISTRASGSTLGSYTDPDPTKNWKFFSDFTAQDYGNAQWTVTETQAGATQDMVAADAAGEYGLLALVNTAGANDINSIQLATAPVFYAGGSKRFWMRARLSRSNADAKVGFGLQAVNATPFTLANGIWMYLSSGGSDSGYAVAKASAVSSAVGSAVYPASALNTFVTLGMYHDGAGNVFCYADDSKVAVITGYSLPDSVVLTPTVSIMNTTANARTAHFDYVFAAIER